MQISKKKINKNLAAQINRLFYQTLADYKKPQDIEEFLKDFLTKTELEVMVKRLAIAYFLDKGRGYENIKRNLAVSSTTIATINSAMKKKGFRQTLRNIHAEEWADKWASKIGKVMKFGRK